MKNISEEISQTLIEHIALGLYKENEKLPSVRELSTKYRVNPNTIAKIYTSLEEKGYIYAVSAKGYYVSKSNDALESNVKEEILPLIKKVVMLSRIIHLEKQDLLGLIEKEEQLYDWSKTFK